MRDPSTGALASRAHPGTAKARSSPEGVRWQCTGHGVSPIGEQMVTSGCTYTLEAAQTRAAVLHAYPEAVLGSHALTPCRRSEEVDEIDQRFLVF